MNNHLSLTITFQSTHKNPEIRSITPRKFNTIRVSHIHKKPLNRRLSPKRQNDDKKSGIKTQRGPPTPPPSAHTAGIDIQLRTGNAGGSSTHSYRPRTGALQLR